MTKKLKVTCSKTPCATTSAYSLSRKENTDLPENYTLEVYYKGYDHEFDDKVINVVGIEEDGAGFAFDTNERDIGFSFKKLSSAVSVARRIRRHFRNVCVKVYNFDLNWNYGSRKHYCPIPPLFSIGYRGKISTKSEDSFPKVAVSK